MSTYDSVFSISFLKSICFGEEGHYEAADTIIHFMPESSHPTEEAGESSQWMKKLHLHKALDTISNGYASTFVHEMGHSLASHLVVPGRSQVYCHTGDASSSTQGYFRPPSDLNASAAWKQTFVNAAGPMSNIAFCSCKLAAGAAIKTYLGWPLALITAGSAVYQMGSELIYAATSAVDGDGDFGSIAKNGPVHLATAGLGLAAECALGIFAAYSMLG